MDDGIQYAGDKPQVGVTSPNVVEYRARLTEQAKGFQGHFEGYPIYPAVCQLDELVLSRAEQFWPELGALERASRIKYQRPLRPGNEVMVRLERDGSKVRFQLRTDEGPVSAGVLEMRARS